MHRADQYYRLISSYTLKLILSSSIWCEYERGLISQELCYRRVSEAFSIHEAEFIEALDQAKSSITVNEELLSTVREIKARSKGTVRVFAMSNTASGEFSLLRRLIDWSVFDEVFISGAVGERKPSIRFYEHVQNVICTDSESVIFVDDKCENVVQALCMGWRALVFDRTANITRQLTNIFGDPIQRSWAYLQRNAKKLHSMSDTGVILEENFAQLLIFEATGDR